MPIVRKKINLVVKFQNNSEVELQAVLKHYIIKHAFL